MKGGDCFFLKKKQEGGPDNRQRGQAVASVVKNNPIRQSVNTVTYFKREGQSVQTYGLSLQGYLDNSEQVTRTEDFKVPCSSLPFF